MGRAATNPDAYKGNHPRDWVEQELPEVQKWQWPPPGVETVPRASVKVPEYRLTDEDMRHIWEGEPNGLDGGHRSESTHRNKVKFPPGWT